MGRKPRIDGRKSAKIQRQNSKNSDSRDHGSFPQHPLSLFASGGVNKGRNVMCASQISDMSLRGKATLSFNRSLKTE